MGAHIHSATRCSPRPVTSTGSEQGFPRPYTVQGLQPQETILLGHLLSGAPTEEPV